MINLNEFDIFCLNLSTIKKYIKKQNKNKNKTNKKLKNKQTKDTKKEKDAKNIKITKDTKDKKQTEKNKIFKNVCNKVEKYYNINKNDTLFWCFYILQNDFFSFETIKNDFIEMNKFRYSYIEHIKKNKKLLKEYKYNIKQIEDNLTNYGNMNIITFSALCYIFKYNFCIFDKNLCYYLNDFNSKLMCVIKKDGKYFIYNEENIEDYVKRNMENKYIINNFSKPFKSLSSYKLNELITIANKLKINIKNKKKNDIYLLLKKYFV